MMEKRSDVEFFQIEGLTKERAKRIYRRVLPFFFGPCGEPVYPADVVIKVFTGDTTHGGHTSAYQFLFDIDESAQTIYPDPSMCDTELCNFVECCQRCECSFYRHAHEEAPSEYTEEIREILEQYDAFHPEGKR